MEILLAKYLFLIILKLFFSHFISYALKKGISSPQSFFFIPCWSFKEKDVNAELVFANFYFNMFLSNLGWGVESSQHT